MTWYNDSAEFSITKIHFVLSLPLLRCRRRRPWCRCIGNSIETVNYSAIFPEGEQYLCNGHFTARRILFAFQFSLNVMHFPRDGLSSARTDSVTSFRVQFVMRKCPFWEWFCNSAFMGQTKMELCTSNCKTMCLFVRRNIEISMKWWRTDPGLGQSIYRFYVILFYSCCELFHCFWVLIAAVSLLLRVFLYGGQQRSEEKPLTRTIIYTEVLNISHFYLFNILFRRPTMPHTHSGDGKWIKAAVWNIKCQTWHTCTAKVTQSFSDLCGGFEFFMPHNFDGGQRILWLLSLLSDGLSFPFVEQSLRRMPVRGAQAERPLAIPLCTTIFVDSLRSKANLSKLIIYVRCWLLSAGVFEQRNFVFMDEILKSRFVNFIQMYFRLSLD